MCRPSILNVSRGDEPVTENEPLSVPTVREVDGQLVIGWPDPRPRQFPITAETFELLVTRANKDHEMLVGLMLDIRATVERWRRDELAIDVAFLEIAARLNTYDEATTDG